MTHTARRGLSLAVALAIVAGGPAAAPAAADDAAVARAYRANDAAGAAVERDGRVALVTFELTGRAGRLLSVLTRAETLIDRTRRAVLAQQASTPLGTAARNLALRGLGFGKQAVTVGRDAVHARQRGERSLYVRLRSRARTLAGYAERDDRNARALFKRLGI